MNIICGPEMRRKTDEISARLHYMANSGRNTSDSLPYGVYRIRHLPCLHDWERADLQVGLREHTIVFLAVNLIEGGVSEHPPTLA